MSNAQPGWFPDPTDQSKLRWWDGGLWTTAVSRNGQVWEEALPPSTPATTQSNPVTTHSVTRPSVPRLKRRRFPVWAWLLVALVLLGPIILLSPIVAPIALVVLVTAIVGLSKGSRTWLRFKTRRAAFGVAAGSAVLLLITGGMSAALISTQPKPPVAAEAARFADTGAGDDSEATPDPTRTSKPTPTPTPTPATTTREEVVTEVIAFQRTTVEDGVLPRGQTAVTVPGQNGQRTLTYVVTLVDGVESGRELTADVVSVAPVDEVTAIGVYDAPAPAPAPAAPVAPTCDSNYADACVPIARDVDCAWGSGDGPAYFDGVARVVGSDVYGLDRNNDGWACEQ